MLILKLTAPEVIKHLTELSILHTDAMAEEPWCEVWSNDLDGTDPRSNSPAMIRKLLEEGADFFIAKTSEGRIVGFAVGLLLSESYLNSMEWGKANCYTPRSPEAGDYEMNLVVVHKDFRNNGLMSKFAESRMILVNEKLSKGRRVWVQTIPPPENPDFGKFGTYKVSAHYLKYGFQFSGKLRIKETDRVFFSLEVK